MRKLISPKLKDKLKQYQPIKVEKGLYCEKCKNKYDLNYFESGYTFRDGCECTMIELGKQEREEERKRFEQRQINKVFNQSQINPSIKDATVNNYKPINPSQEQAKQSAVEYVQNFSTSDTKSLIFYGAFGTGKSHLAYAIAKAIKAQGYKVAFMNISKLMNRIKETYNKNANETTNDIINMLSQVDLLVLDDIGVEDTDHTLNKLFDVIDNRIGLNNIYTTNLTKQQLKKNTSWGRIYSRMNKGSRHVLVKGDDYRESETW